MRTAAIALATALSLTGAAFAKDAADKGAALPNTPVETIDTGTTNSIYKSTHGIIPTTGASDRRAGANTADRPFASRLGIDVNPNFLPTYK